MSAMDDRRSAAETKFALTAEQEFKVDARRNKLLAIWAAPLAGRSDLESYIGEVIASDFEEAGDEDVLRKLKADLDKGGAGMSEEEIRAKMDELHNEARAQIAAGE